MSGSRPRSNSDRALPEKGRTGRPKGPARAAPSISSAAQAEDSISQLTLKMRTSQHRELAKLAFDADMTMRGFVMRALKEQGLEVTPDDLVDRRRR